jgi:ATP-binding cassette subfamily B protein
MSLLFLFQISIGFLRRYVSLKMGKDIETALFGKYLEKITRLPMRFFGMHTTGDIVSRASDTEQIKSTLSGSAVQAVLSMAMMIGVMGVLLVWNASMALVALGTLGFIVLLFLAHLPPYNRIIRVYKEAAARRHSRMIEDISAMETIKAFGMADRRITEAAELQENYQNAGIRLGILSHSAMSVTGFASNLAGVAALCLGAHFVIQGTHSLGDMMFFYMMIGLVIGPLQEIAGIFMGWRQARVAMTRFEEILQEKDEETIGEEWSDLREGIRMNEVSFQYGYRKTVLDGINMEINRGERIAIVGESGSGKTTLAKLLVRFHDPIKGNVLFDGKSSREIAIDSLRSRVIYVPQDPFVFNMSIRENIASARPDASLEEIIAVARDARLHDFISSLPDGYDTLCGENGKNLSGGQQQRLAIARTLLADPDVVIFDEATCHLDVETERSLYEALKTHLEGKTVILIAHRLNTILQADRIFFLKDGRIAEEGSHRELMAARGHYAKLWTRQEIDLQENREETHRRTSTGRCTRVA